MRDVLGYFAEIIEAAGAGPLALAALLALLLAFIASRWFAKDNTAVRIAIFAILFLGAAGLSIILFIPQTSDDEGAQESLRTRESVTDADTVVFTQTMAESGHMDVTSIEPSLIENGDPLNVFCTGETIRVLNASDEPIVLVLGRSETDLYWQAGIMPQQRYETEIVEPVVLHITEKENRFHEFLAFVDCSELHSQKE